MAILFWGGVALVALFDGGVKGLVSLGSALLVGGGAYISTRYAMNALPTKIIEIQKEVLDKDLAAFASQEGVTPQDVKAKRKEIQDRIKDLETTLERQRWGNKEVATLIGIGSFAFPPFGLAAIAATSTAVPVAAAISRAKARGKMRAIDLIALQNKEAADKRDNSQSASSVQVVA